MYNDLVSVIIGTYNQAVYLRESIDSITRQTYQNIEIIVIDDASTDNTAEILAEYGDRIKTITHGTNSGLAGARNSGISVASGQWIKFHDSDDVLEPYAIERIMKFVDMLQPKTATNCMITYRYRLIDSNGRPIVGHYPNILPASIFNNLSQYEKNVLLLKQRVIIGTFMAHKSLFEKYGVFDPDLRTVEDIDIAYRFCLHHGVELLCMDDVLRRYRRHDTNTTRRENMLMEKEILFDISRRAFSAIDSKVQNMYREMLVDSTDADSNESLETRLMYMLTYVYPVSRETYRNFLEYRKTLLDLQSEFDEKAQWADRLNLEVSDKDKKITRLQSELDKRNSDVATIQNQFNSLQSEYFEILNSIEKIKRSIIYDAFVRMTCAVDKIFPPGTKRGNMLALVKMAMLTYKNEGWTVLQISMRHKLGKHKVSGMMYKRLRSEHVHRTARIKAFMTHMQDIDSRPDPKLRKFVRFDSHSIQISRMPKISIIIPTFDQVGLLKRNLDAIRAKTTYTNYEIIIVTNNLDEQSPMRKFLSTANDCTVCVFDREYSFSSVNNFASSKTSGEFLLFLNDDVEIVSSNWLEWLLKLGLDEHVGAVSGKVLFSDSRLQEAGCIVFNDGNMWNYGRGSDIAEPQFNYVRDIDYGSGCCLLVRKNVFDAVGGFDESYRPAYVEDVDLCFQIKKAGLRVLYQPACMVIHHEGKTQGTSTNQGIKSYQVTNISKFYKKWGSWISDNHTGNTGDIQTARDRKRGLRILYIDHYIPEPDKDSGSMRTFGMLGILASLESKITFWPDNLERTEPYCTELQQKGIEVIYGPHDMKEFLSERNDMYDIVILSRPHVAAKYIDIVKKSCHGCAIVYDTVDLHFRRMQKQQNVQGNVSDSEIASMRDTELSIMKASDLVLLTSRNEEAILEKDHDFDGIRFAILSNMHETIHDVPSFESRSGIIFVGGFQHPPNVDAVRWFVTEIFPIIKKNIPSVILYIVGSNPPVEVTELASENIRVIGYVHDMSEFLFKCKVMVAPLRFGSGVKGKITQGISYGIPVVTTLIGAEGIGLTDGKDCIISDDPIDFARKTAELYEDQNTWTKISRNAMSVADRHSYENARINITRAISGALDNNLDQ